MFFTSLQALMAQTQSKIIHFTVVKVGDELTLTVIPDVNSGNGLLMPLSLTGTAKELDEGAANALNTYGGERLSLSEQIAETTKQLQNEAKEKLDSAKAKSSKANPTKGATTKPVSAEEEEQDEEDDVGGNAESPQQQSSDVASMESNSVNAGADNVFALVGGD